MSKVSSARKPPVSIRLSPVYEYGLNQIADREGVPLGTLLRRIIEEWAQAYTRDQAAQVSEYIQTSNEGKLLTAFGDAALIDLATMEERAAAAKKPRA